LLFPLKRSPPRKYGITRRSWSAARTVKRNEGRAFWPPILLLLKPERPQT
jgi:hypothetical protein